MGEDPADDPGQEGADEAADRSDEERIAGDEMAEEPSDRDDPAEPGDPSSDEETDLEHYPRLEVSAGVDIEDTDATTEDADATTEDADATTEDADDTTGEEDGDGDDLPDDPDATTSGPDTSGDEADLTAVERKATDGPQTDEEQPIADHVEEMIKRLGVVLVIAGGVSLAAFPFAEGVITFLWYSVLPGSVSQPHVYHPLELLLTQLKTASLAGLVIALPAFVYESYAFMRPGLYPHERRYYLAAVPTSLVLALVGVTFAYFIVLPAVMNYFLYYSDSVVDIAFALGQTFTLILVLMGYLALVFQIPLFIMLAIMMGLTTRQWMADRRLIFWGVFLGLSFLFSPDPTGMAPIIVAATMVTLFEGTLLLLRWTNRG